jgi:hypothetical protein
MYCKGLQYICEERIINELGLDAKIKNEKLTGRSGKENVNAIISNPTSAVLKRDVGAQVGFQSVGL